MFEHHHEPLLPYRRYLGRVFRHGGLALLLLLGALAVGVLGYHSLEHLSFLDALLNAAMILGGEGPVTPMLTSAGKVFASAYAIFCGVVFLVGVGLLLAPVFHRFLHRFHLEDESSDPKQD